MDDGIKHAQRVERLAKKDEETVARADRQGVAFCQLDHCGIGAAAAHEALSRRLAERQGKLRSRQRADQLLVPGLRPF